MRFTCSYCQTLGSDVPLLPPSFFHKVTTIILFSVLFYNIFFIFDFSTNFKTGVFLVQKIRDKEKRNQTKNMHVSYILYPLSPSLRFFLFSLNLCIFHTFSCQEFLLFPKKTGIFGYTTKNEQLIGVCWAICLLINRLKICR